MRPYPALYWRPSTALQVVGGSNPAPPELVTRFMHLDFFMPSLGLFRSTLLVRGYGFKRFVLEMAPPPPRPRQPEQALPGVTTGLSIELALVTESVWSTSPESDDTVKPHRKRCVSKTSQAVHSTVQKFFLEKNAVKIKDFHGLTDLFGGSAFRHI